MAADPLCHISPMGALHGTDLDLDLDPMQHLSTESGDNSRRYHSPADKCKISPFCAFNDKSMKLGTKLEGIIRNIFSYRAIADLSRDPNGSHFKMTS